MHRARFESLETRTLFSVPSPSNVLEIAPIGTFSTGSTGVAEIVAHDPASQKLFSLNGANNRLDVLDISTPSNPTKVSEISLALYGAFPNSVAVKNGVVAVAMEAGPKTNAGKVVFFNTFGGFINVVSVGAPPDMLTFTPDGTKVLVANEAEQNDVDEPSPPALVNPEGSISIINIAGGVTVATVSTATFTAFNGQEANLRLQGVRITAGQSFSVDAEPEYIAVAPDGLTARITLQENNALAVLDIATGTITSVQALGLKDYSTGVPQVANYDFGTLPSIGTTAPSTAFPSGQDLKLGGFSGLHFEGTTVDGKLKFIANTDRGPNGEPSNSIPAIPGNERPFALPNFQPELVRFELDQGTGQITITSRIKLTKADGSPLTGLPNLQAGAQGTPYTDEVGVDLNGVQIANDPFGADLEGIVTAPDGSFWMPDEYRPAIYHFDATGKLLDRFVPAGTAASVGAAAGTFGTETLPAVYGQFRRANRGFEAIAMQGTKIYAFIQTNLDNPTGSAAIRNNGVIRIVEIESTTGAVTGEFVYVMRDTTAAGLAKTDKIGDAVSLGGGKFLVVERDDRTGADSNKLIYEINLTGASNVAGTPIATASTGTTLEGLNAAGLASNGIRPVDKRLVVNAAAIGYTGISKLEGLALVDSDTIAVINDNDFAMAGPIAGDGVAPINPNPEPIRLGLIDFSGSNGLDASDRDTPGSSNVGIISINKQPVFGMYMPDTVGAYSVGGQNYYVTANEGDDRDDFITPDETIRVGAGGYDLDNATFPNEATLKDNDILGRLTVSNIDGDIDSDGDKDRIHAYGARSFSIWDSAGNRVFDSGDALERITEALAAARFNSDGSAVTFDTRSDNKGPEPEGLAVGVIDGRTYAFVALERTGGIVTYDVTNPVAPQFVTFTNLAAGDISPEGMVFITAANSPTGKPMLAVGNEVSGTTTLYSVNVNEKPTVGDQTFAVNEKSPATTVVGTVAASDANLNQTLIYEIIGGNTGGAFAINPSTGQITVASALPLVFQANPSFSLIVKVTDDGSPLPNDFDTAVVTVNLVNLNDFSIADTSVVEGNSGERFLEYTVSRDASAGVAGVNFATVGGLSTAGVDYQSANGSVIFGDGETSKLVKVKVFGDTTIETDNTVIVELSSPVNGSIADGSAVGTIINDDAPSMISVNDVSVTEGNSGTKTVTFSVSLNSASPNTVKVNYATANGTAVSGSDYVATNGQLTFFSGQTSKTVSVTVKGDTAIEPNEAFFLNLSNAVNATLADSQGRVTVINDDPAPVVLPKLSVAGVRAAEGNSGTKLFSFLVTLDKASSQSITVNYATSNGTASAGLDYIAKSGVVTFSAGQTSKTVTVTVKGDTTRSINETFFVTLSNPVNATVAVAKATGTIVNDD